MRSTKSVGHLCVAVAFCLLRLPVAGEVVQGAVLHESSEGEDEADGDKQVHRSHVGDFGQGLPGDGAQSGHGEHRGDTWTGLEKCTHWLKF